MSVEIIKEMEQRNDPVFVEVLQYAQDHLTQEGNERIRIERPKQIVVGMLRDTNYITFHFFTSKKIKVV